jgi:hypothetical protein
MRAAHNLSTIDDKTLRGDVSSFTRRKKKASVT